MVSEEASTSWQAGNAQLRAEHAQQQEPTTAPSTQLPLAIARSLPDGCIHLGQRALAGRDCTSPQDVDAALRAGVDDWNQRPTPFLWGQPPTPMRHLKRQYVYRI